MKKENLKIFVSILLSVFLISLVSAQTTGWQRFGQGIVSVWDSLGITHNLTVILLGALLWIILYSIVKQVFNYENKWVPAGVSLIIVILTFIFIPKDLTEAIALQYTAMGAAILTIVPFAIILYFTLNVLQSNMAARITWIFYIVYYFSIFIYKLGSSTLPFQEAILQTENLFYIGAIIAGFIIFAFTPKIKKLIFKGKLTDKELAAEQGLALRRTGRKLMNQESKDILNSGSNI